MTGKCEVCKTYTEIEEHHCMGGRTGNRKTSNKYPELKFMLCATGCHRGTNGGAWEERRGAEAEADRTSEVCGQAWHGIVDEVIWEELSVMVEVTDGVPL